MDIATALRQNPKSPAPPEVLAALRLLDITYWGFDNILHQGQIVMHTDTAEDVRTFFARAVELKFPIAKMIPITDPRYAWDDDRSCADNNTAGYNYRVIAGSDRLSKHALGLAFDVNPVQNPYIRFEAEKEVFRFPPESTYDTSALGTLTAGHPLVVMMKERGWEWGGDWTPESGRIDYQHFAKRIERGLTDLGDLLVYR